MKSSLLRTFFEWALITSVLMSVGFFVWFWLNSRASIRTRAQIAKMDAAYRYNQAAMERLMLECQAYAKTNTDLARFLAPQTPPATPAPAATTKPGGK
jgi:hypothetical protein